MRRVRRELRKHGWSVGLKATREAGDATRLAREAAAQGMDGVWVAGGDGTICEAVNGLVGSATAMGVLPAGTGNVWARQLRLPIRTVGRPHYLEQAAADQAQGQIKAVDVGQFGERCFFLWAGIGFDAMLTDRLEPRPRPIKRLGALPYLIAAVSLARDYAGVQCRITLDNETRRRRILMILVSNIQMYTYFNVVRQARLDDGLLDGCSDRRGHRVALCDAARLSAPERATP
jgi:YegS/Rv2252/BmrU family lipid kinase